MCFGGGGNAAGAAQAEEAQRAAGIASNVRNINSAFANRGAQYDTYENALQDQYQTELNRQQGIASRNNKFALARSGLTGGSAAVDAGKLLSQDEQRGTINAQQQVQGAVAKLQGLTRRPGSRRSAWRKVAATSAMQLSRRPIACAPTSATHRARTPLNRSGTSLVTCRRAIRT
jgi:hypothetical protein